MKPSWFSSAGPAPRGRSGRRAGRAPTFASLAIFCVAAGACYGPEAERLSCDDIYAPGQFDFRTLQALVASEDKGCLDAPCHTAETQREGVRLDTPQLVYEELSTRPDDFYAVLASGVMPEEGTRWSDEDLKVFRSWYCAGAFPP